MGKIEEYRRILQGTADWDHYLLAESCLPGPRANLELAHAVAEEGGLDLFRRYLSYTSTQAPYGSTLEFLPLCGVIGLGRVLSEGRLDLLPAIRICASDPRWRMREGVAMALQRFGDADMNRLLQEMEDWSHGNLLEKRAAIASLCEPRLLKKVENTRRVLVLLDQITRDFLEEEQRKTDEFVALRKALGYCWSVITVANPEDGKNRMERWFSSQDQDIRWIMRENLKKNRLQKIDREWTERWLSALSNKA